MTEQLHFHFSLSCIGEGNANPLQCSCLENPRDGGAWLAAVYGVAQSQTRLKRLSNSSSSRYGGVHSFSGEYSLRLRQFPSSLQLGTFCLPPRGDLGWCPETPLLVTAEGAPGLQSGEAGGPANAHHTQERDPRWEESSPKRQPCQGRDTLLSRRCACHPWGLSLVLGGPPMGVAGAPTGLAGRPPPCPQCHAKGL